MVCGVEPGGARIRGGAGRGGNIWSIILFSQGRHGDAIIFYTEAVNALARACSLDATLSPLLMPHLQQYNDRAAQLRQQQAGERQRGVSPHQCHTQLYSCSPPLPSPCPALSRQRSTEEVFDKVRLPPGLWQPMAVLWDKDRTL